MAITRLWQAGAEVDTTNSHNMEFDTVNASFAANATEQISGAYSYRFYDYDDYALQAFTATRQLRMGFWWRQSTYTTNDTGLISFKDGGGTTLVMFGGDAGSTTTLRLEVGGAERDILPLGINTGVWCHIGIDILIDNATGWAKVYKDGIEILSFTGNTGNANLASFRLGSDGGFASNDWVQYCYADDLYLDDTTGEAAAPPPDLRFEFISPDGIGNYSVWDPTPGAGEDNYEDVDERPNDGDASYVEAQALNERDSYTMTTYAMPAGWAIEAVIPTAIAKKTDGGTDTEINLMTRQGGVDDDGSDQDLPTAYGLLWDRFPLDPGGGPWSQADLDSVECGYRGRGAF